MDRKSKQDQKYIGKVDKNFIVHVEQIPRKSRERSNYL